MTFTWSKWLHPTHRGYADAPRLSQDEVRPVAPALAGLLLLAAGALPAAARTQPFLPVARAAQPRPLSRRATAERARRAGLLAQALFERLQLHIECVRQAVELREVRVELR
jgi:hypothetical protein